MTVPAMKTEQEEVLIMSDCSICGKKIPIHEGVVRLMKTGQYSSGRDYFRNVNLCIKCDTDQDGVDQSRKVQKVLLVVGVMVTFIAGGAYLLFVR